MTLRRVVVFADGSWQELDANTTLVLCTDEALKDANTTGREPVGIRFNLLLQLLRAETYIGLQVGDPPKDDDDGEW